MKQITEEKASELSKKFARQYHANNWPEWSDDEAFHYSNEEINKACLEMAQWKDEQYNEEKKELLVLVNMLSVDEHNQTIIEDLKALLQ